MTFPPTKHVARKTYACNACEWIDALLPYNLGDYEMTYAELREIVKARRNLWRIMPGQLYLRQPTVEDGHFTVWRGLIPIHMICLKYDIYDYV